MQTQRSIHFQKAHWLSTKLIHRGTTLCSVAVSIALLAGCSPGEAGKLMGNWEIADVESVSERVGGETEEPNAKMSVEFSSSGKLTTRTQIGSIDSVKIGSWELVSNDPDNGVMNIACVLGGQTTQHEIEFVDDSSITWIPPNMAGTTRRLKFERIR